MRIVVGHDDTVDAPQHSEPHSEASPCLPDIVDTRETNAADPVKTGDGRDALVDRSLAEGAPCAPNGHLYFWRPYLMQSRPQARLGERGHRLSGLVPKLDAVDVRAVERPLLIDARFPECFE